MDLADFPYTAWWIIDDVAIINVTMATSPQQQQQQQQQMHYGKIDPQNFFSVWSDPPRRGGRTVKTQNVGPITEVSHPRAHAGVKTALLQLGYAYKHQQQMHSGKIDPKKFFFRVVRPP